jgi:hypothetical protein
MRQLLLAIILAGCSSERVTSNGAIPRTSSPMADASALAPVHSVTGHGDLKPGPGFEFAVSVAVHQDATGRVWGRVVTSIIDLSVFGLSGTGEIIQEPVCMRVVGNTAYIGTVLVKTYDENVEKVGDRGVFWVQNGGKDGGDVAYGGPSSFWDPTNAICTSTPPQLPPVAVDKGNFNVQ